ncbi:hypothetical protein L1887_28032 [Cichorium endivia]|nr:hypothetical protein L1887_28032 [Cichorium endivia]
MNKRPKIIKETILALKEMTGSKGYQKDLSAKLVESVVLPIGRLSVGICRHRALLFKTGLNPAAAGFLKYTIVVVVAEIRQPRVC